MDDCYSLVTTCKMQVPQLNCHGKTSSSLIDQHMNLMAKNFSQNLMTKFKYSQSLKSCWLRFHQFRYCSKMSELLLGLMWLMRERSIMFHQKERLLYCTEFSAIRISQAEPMRSINIVVHFWQKQGGDAPLFPSLLMELTRKYRISK